jgi:NADPH:quinone reductase
LTETTPPRAGHGELLVRIRAAGINRAEYLQTLVSDKPLPGSEFSGEVLDVGPGVEGWAVGDRIMGRGAGFSRDPVLVSARLVMPVPDTFSWEEAAALPVALMTMHDAIVTHGKLAPGESVLVHAATSGVGLVAVQLAALFGASVVYATSRSASKLEVLRTHLGELPCEVIGIDTSTTPFESVAKHVDLIVDNVGASVLAGNMVAAAITGRIIQIGRLGGRLAEIDLDELARKRVELIGVTFRTRSDDEVADIVARAVADVGDRMEALRPRVDRTYPQSEVAQAVRDLADDQHVGKLVVINL